MIGKKRKKIYLNIIISLFICSILLSYLVTIQANDPVVQVGHITRIKGIRDNQLMGFGIVMGLAGSGDSTRSQATIQSVSNMLEKYGINVTPDQIRSRNLAAVMVTATLPPFSHTGDKIDVTVNSMGDARSIQGGTLLMTPLKAANGKVYAVAQGSVSIGGYNVQGAGYQMRENHPTVARIPNGALVEKELSFDLSRKQLTYLLKQPNYETASAIAEAVNKKFKDESETKNIFAQAEDAGQIVIEVPDNYQNNVVEFISKINNIKVQSSMPAKVVLNEKTGTVVMGHNVQISTVSVQQNNFSVKITTDNKVSQPPSFSEGETKEITDKNVEVSEEDEEMKVIEGKGNIQDLVTALNTLGASSSDIIAIIQAIKAAGALHAELVIM